MNDSKLNSAQERHQAVIVDGVELDVRARLMEKDRWELSIGNALGIRTVWIEWFDSAEEAIKAGLTAVETEGIAEFTSAEGFEYLFDD